MQKYVILQSFSTEMTYEGKRISIVLKIYN